MYYVDSQRTVTQRESSLLPRGIGGSLLEEDSKLDLDGQRRSIYGFKLPGESNTVRLELEGFQSRMAVRAPVSISHIAGATDSSTSMVTRPNGSVEKEIVTSFFESMLDCIIQSWEVISLKQDSPRSPPKTPAITTENVDKKKKPPASAAKSDKRRKSIHSSSMDARDALANTPNPLQIVWWAEPDEKAVIHFKNGNMYEGNISMKCMNGEGRFQWADGSIYLGEFKNNVITGKGKLQWKDECWYEGEFAGNLRHGKGLYVESKRQRSYSGDWYIGTKHGNGTMYYSADFTDYYDGEWQKNIRQGHGIREYCKQSGYNGDWDYSVRHGKGIMIWPNRDFYAGDWKNALMSGYGRYLWDVYYNNTMTLPPLISYDGQWLHGDRNGFGTLELGYELGSFYQGEFKNMKKHGQGHLITNNGLILIDKELFQDDLLGTHITALDVVNDTLPDNSKKPLPNEPYQLKMCHELAGLHCHIRAALFNLDRQAEIRAHVIRKYFENNKHLYAHLNQNIVLDNKDDRRSIDLNNFIRFEEYSLLNKIKFYESRLRDIYTTYSNTCTTEKVTFAPVLIRLFLWQFYYDCDIHEWGLSLVDIDNMFHKNREFISQRPHNPFEPIQFWQFTHSLIMVANELFAKRYLPGPQPDTILAEAFKTFMDDVALPAHGRFRGYLQKDYGSIVSLKSMYKLYQSIGEPHTVRDFLCAVRRSPLMIDQTQPELIDGPDNQTYGRNVYLFGDKMIYYVSDVLARIFHKDSENKNEEEHEDLRLYNFGNLSSKTIIKIFTNILAGVSEDNQVQNLDIQYTFMEFFQAFIGCAEESVRVKEEEIRWRELIGVPSKKRGGSLEDMLSFTIYA